MRLASILNKSKHIISFCTEERCCTDKAKKEKKKKKNVISHTNKAEFNLFHEMRPQKFHHHPVYNLKPI
jgi:hypothetical protein